MHRPQLFFGTRWSKIPIIGLLFSLQFNVFLVITCANIYIYIQTLHYITLHYITIEYNTIQYITYITYIHICIYIWLISWLCSSNYCFVWVPSMYFCAFQPGMSIYPKSWMISPAKLIPDAWTDMCAREESWTHKHMVVSMNGYKWGYPQNHPIYRWDFPL
jgi:hypothetical protein